MVLEVLGDVLCVWGVYNLWKHNYVQSARSRVLEVLGDALCDSGCSGYLQSGKCWVIYCQS